jgi:hypothetical protein
MQFATLSRSIAVLSSSTVAMPLWHHSLTRSYSMWVAGLRLRCIPLPNPSCPVFSVVTTYLQYRWIRLLHTRLRIYSMGPRSYASCVPTCSMLLRLCTSASRSVPTLHLHTNVLRPSAHGGGSRVANALHIQVCRPLLPSCGSHQHISARRLGTYAIGRGI